jgi:hypothetical protein
MSFSKDACVDLEALAWRSTPMLGKHLAGMSTVLSDTGYARRVAEPLLGHLVAAK